MTKQNRALKRAKHALEILEEQAAGYTVLTIPPKLVIEIEEKRKEIARLEERAEEGDADPLANNLPRRHPFFGREKEIARALESLEPDKRVWGVMIDGIGGIGKTALAVEIAHLAYERGKFDVVLFTTAKKTRLTAAGEQPVGERMAALEAMLGDLARDLGQPGVAQRSGGEQRRAFLAFLRRYSSRERRVLLIFDNLETLPSDDLAPLFELLLSLPQPCKAIVTSRRRRAGEGGVWLRLEKLDWPAAQELIAERMRCSPRLERTLERAGRARWQELYDAAGGSPLALHWTLGLMQRRNLSVKRALALLREGGATDSLLEFIYHEARRDMGDADWRVLGALALFAAPATFDALAAVTDLPRLALESALERLDAYALVDAAGPDGPYTLHPLTRRLAAGELAARPETAAPLQERFTGYWVDYAQRYGGSSKNYRTHDRLEAAWPNLEAAAVLLHGRATEDEKTAQSLNKLAGAVWYFLWMRGYWEEAVRLSSWAYQAMVALEEWRDAGWCAYRVAFIHYNRAETELAARWAGRMTEAMERGGSRHDRAEATRLCGMVARQRGDLDEAERLYTEALAVYRALEAEENQAIVLNSLGELLREQKEYARAEGYYREALAIDEKRGDKEGQAIYLGNLGELALDRGRVAEAQEWFERALPLAEEVGRQDLISHAKWGLARVLEEEGRAAEALPLARAALKICERLGDKDVEEARELVARLERGELKVAS